MAAKAYVVAMTVSELKEELKQRGLSTKGTKKDLRDRLEQALYDEELDDPESEAESDSGAGGYSMGMAAGGFNFEVPPESFIAEEDILAEYDEAESMIVSVQLINRDRLEVHPCGNASSRMAVGVGDRTIGDGSLSPMIVAIELGNNSAEETLGGVADRQLDRALDPVRVSEDVITEKGGQTGVNGTPPASNQIDAAKESNVEPTSQGGPAESAAVQSAVTTQPESSMEVSTAQQAPEEVPTTVEPLTNVEQPTEEPNGMATISMPDSAGKVDPLSPVTTAPPSDDPIVPADHVMIERTVEQPLATQGAAAMLDESTLSKAAVATQGAAAMLDESTLSKAAAKDAEELMMKHADAEELKHDADSPINVTYALEEVANNDTASQAPSNKLELTIEATTAIEATKDDTEITEEAAKKEIEITPTEEAAKNVSQVTPIEEAAKDDTKITPTEDAANAETDLTEEAVKNKTANEEAPKDEEMEDELPVDRMEEATKDEPVCENIAPKEENVEATKDEEMEDELPDRMEEATKDEPVCENIAPEKDNVEATKDKEMDEEMEDELPVDRKEEATKDEPVCENIAPKEENVEATKNKTEATITSMVMETTATEEATKNKTEAIMTSLVTERKNSETTAITEEAAKEENEANQKEAAKEESEAGPLETSQMDMEFSVHVAEDDFCEFPNDSNSVAKKSHDQTRRTKVSHDQTTKGKRSRQGSRSDSDSSTVKKRRISTSNPSAATTPIDRKRKWGSGRQRSSSGSTPAINSDHIQDMIPAEVSQLVELGQLDCEGAEVVESVEETIPDTKEKEKEEEQHREEQRREKQRALKEMETRHRIEARLKAKREAELAAKQQQRRRTPPPSRHAPSRILHVVGLTRPFTKDELRELLSQDGTLLQDAFWIDKIRSHCIAVYDTKDIAMATRERVHGIKWPTTSPKYLCADFLSPGEVGGITGGQLLIQEETDSEHEDKVAAVESSLPPVDPPVAMDTVEKAPSSAKPTLLLDELFRKTKATPSIYWLPLTELQVTERMAAEVEREQERESRRATWMAQRQVEEQQKVKGRGQREKRNRHSRSRSRDRRRR